MLVIVDHELGRVPTYHQTTGESTINVCNRFHVDHWVGIDPAGLVPFAQKPSICVHVDHHTGSVVLRLALLHTLKYLIAVNVDHALGNVLLKLLEETLILVRAVHAHAGKVGKVPTILFDGKLTCVTRHHAHVTPCQSHAVFQVASPLNIHLVFVFHDAPFVELYKLSRPLQSAADISVTRLLQIDASS